jgi:hypothetical protein
VPGARLPVGQGSVRAGNGAWIQASPGCADESSGSRPGRLLLSGVAKYAAYHGSDGASAKNLDLGRTDLTSNLQSFLNQLLFRFCKWQP